MLDVADGLFDARRIRRTPGVAFGPEPVSPETTAARWGEIARA